MSDSGDECTCACHHNSDVKHVAPCCDGPCDICCRYIALGGMPKHLSEEHGDPVGTDQHRMLDPKPDS